MGYYREEPNESNNYQEAHYCPDCWHYDDDDNIEIDLSRKKDFDV